MGRAGPPLLSSYPPTLSLSPALAKSRAHRFLPVARVESHLKYRAFRSRRPAVRGKRRQARRARRHSFSRRVERFPRPRPARAAPTDAPRRPRPIATSRGANGAGAAPFFARDAFFSFFIFFSFSRSEAVL